MRAARRCAREKLQVLFQCEDHRVEVVRHLWFHLEQISAQVQRALDVLGMHRVGQHHDGQILEGLRAKPGEDFKAVLERHFQIEQQ